MLFRNDAISFGLGFFSGFSKKILSDPLTAKENNSLALLLSSPAFLLALIKGYRDGTFNHSFLITVLGFKSGALAANTLISRYGPEMIHGQHRSYRRLNFGK